jgi:hypothetical protein
MSQTSSIEPVRYPIYLAIDPGEKYNGWATFSDTGDLIEFGTVEGADPFTDWLENFPIEKLRQVIVEDYRIGQVRGGYGAAKHQGSRALTVGTIGRIESWVYRNRLAPIVKQANNIKTVGYMWAGIEVPKSKAMTHQTDAFVHGVYWLQKNGIRRPMQGINRAT